MRIRLCINLKTAMRVLKAHSDLTSSKSLGFSYTRMGPTHGSHCEERHKDGLFYLFICRAMTAYNQTHVYWSDSPLNFPKENFLCELPGHASEVIRVSDGEWYISNTGWDKQGLYIAPLEWN